MEMAGARRSDFNILMCCVGVREWGCTAPCAPRSAPITTTVCEPNSLFEVQLVCLVLSRYWGWACALGVTEELSLRSIAILLHCDSSSLCVCVCVCVCVSVWLCVRLYVSLWVALIHSSARWRRREGRREGVRKGGSN